MTQKDVLRITCICHLLKYVVKIFLVSAILHYICLLRLLPKSYFKISTLQPNFLCSSSFNVSSIYYHLFQLVNAAIADSIRFLENTPDNVIRSNKYMLAITTYALALSKSKEKTQHMKWLMDTAIVDDSKSFKVCKTYYNYPTYNGFFIYLFCQSVF